MLLGIVCAQHAFAGATANPEPSATTPATSTTPAASTAEPLTVAVLDVRAAPGTEGVAKALTTLLTSELGNRAGFRTVSRGELKGLLAHQADQRLLGCDKPDCYADIGKLLQAKRVVYGTLEKAEGGDAAVFSVTLLDPEGPVVLERVAYTWKSNLDDMVDLVRPAVDHLVHGKLADGFAGNLELLAPEGATVVVDDKALGAAPIKPLRDLPIGVHHIEVRKGGFLPWNHDVAISQHETQVVQADLIDEASVQPWFARWYVWGSALAGVVVVGGTAAAIGTYEYLGTPAKLIVGNHK
jgi:hypothetical protein